MRAYEKSGTRVFFWGTTAYSRAALLCCTSGALPDDSCVSTLRATDDAVPLMYLVELSYINIMLYLQASKAARAAGDDGNS